MNKPKKTNQGIKEKKVKQAKDPQKIFILTFSLPVYVFYVHVGPILAFHHVNSFRSTVSMVSTT